MKDNSLSRILIIILSVVVFLVVVVLNALAGSAISPFLSSAANVSARYETDITPAGWTFSIWSVIYIWLSLMLIYITSFVFRGSWAQSLLPYGFYLSWLCSMLLNITWIFLWDRELMVGALVVLILIAFSNYSALFFCCYATDYYGLWLQTHHRKDLACLRILVQNGLTVYTTWTSVASLINFAVVLELWGVDRSTAATVSLSLVLADVVGWFILETWVLDRWVRNILTVYPVLIVALVGNVDRHFNPDDPTTNSVFTVVLLVLACLLFVSRVCTVIWKNQRRPLHSPDLDKQMVSPLDGSKSKIFR
ncbi:uncharacterized protein LOC106524078 [Austrofundulus limnaeus]|uniref:Uncharacterized protein LOC106524078 n=1 Tax=Austrofundulus limnaeus TaxID=52670 RepID=A0A2I4BZK5_AUSLI|nr:PREDICTED: uncharacterized protein LOC106524078 [Austrofundulus limnaeus]